MRVINKFTVAGLVAVWFGFVAMRPGHANERVSCTTVSPTRITCRIDEPAVTRRLTTYPQITFRPGDSVTVQAGGCVQTGGSGKTWKRYVNPSGSDSDRLYHGLIRIPGVESDLVRVAGLIIHPVTVAATMNPGAPSLQLGYEDDDYSDNGYWGHDDGTENQCHNVGNAFVVLTIDRAGPPPGAPAPFDLVFTATDPNGFPLNPIWGWQKLHPGALPNAITQCFNLPGIFANAGCTTQSPSLDLPDGLNGRLCKIYSDTSIYGHVNWMPATWQGPVSWESHSSPPTDDDYNINLVPPADEGLTSASDGHIHTEFDSDETIDHFRTPWWQSFHDAVDKGDANARAMIDGKFAIVIGLAGLDCEHSCGMELHPVYGIAVHVNDDPQDDAWAIFVRNWGDEGYCSQDNHPLDTTRMAFLLPRVGATAVKVASATFLANSSDTSGPAVSLLAGQGAVVAFGLPTPDKSARINGELHLQWTTRSAVSGGLQQGSLPVVARIERQATPTAPEAEERLEEMQNRLPEAKRQALAASLARPKSFDEMTPKPQAVIPATSVARAAVRVEANPVKEMRDQQRAAALCAAFGNNIPDLPNACAPAAK